MVGAKCGFLEDEGVPSELLDELCQTSMTLRLLWQVPVTSKGGSRVTPDVNANIPDVSTRMPLGFARGWHRSSSQ